MHWCTWSQHSCPVNKCLWEKAWRKVVLGRKVLGIGPDNRDNECSEVMLPSSGFGVRELQVTMSCLICGNLEHLINPVLLPISVPFCVIIQGFCIGLKTWTVSGLRTSYLPSQSVHLYNWESDTFFNLYNWEIVPYFIGLLGLNIREIIFQMPVIPYSKYNYIQTYLYYSVLMKTCRE